MIYRKKRNQVSLIIWLLAIMLLFHNCRQEVGPTTPILTIDDVLYDLNNAQDLDDARIAVEEFVEIINYEDVINEEERGYLAEFVLDDDYAGNYIDQYDLYKNLFSNGQYAFEVPESFDKMFSKLQKDVDRAYTSYTISDAIIKIMTATDDQLPPNPPDIKETKLLSIPQSILFGSWLLEEYGVGTFSKSSTKSISGIKNSNDANVAFYWLKIIVGVNLLIYDIYNELDLATSGITGFTEDDLNDLTRELTKSLISFKITSPTPITPVDENQIAQIIEDVVNDIANKLGIDPVEFDNLKVEDIAEEIDNFIDTVQIAIEQGIHDQGGIG